jgi:hypothetical protein
MCVIGWSTAPLKKWVGEGASGNVKHRVRVWVRQEYFFIQFDRGRDV